MATFSHARFLAHAAIPGGAFHGWVLLALAWAALSVGCGAPTAPPAPSGSSSPVQVTGSLQDENRVDVHDAGEVLAGHTITHTFAVHNSLPESVEIKGEADVQANCGCSSLVPKDRRLESGQTTGVTITIDTARRQGLLLQGGTVVWTSASGQRWKSAFAIRAVIQPAMRPSVPVLSFNDKEIRSGAAKEVVFKETVVSLRWDTVKVSTSAPFEIMSTNKVEKGVRCTVKCTPGQNMEDVQGQLVAVGESVKKGGERWGDEDYDLWLQYWLVDLPDRTTDESMPDELTVCSESISLPAGRWRAAVRGQSRMTR
jgi:hypothetical protein